jgi:hypothetical protein
MPRLWGQPPSFDPRFRLSFRSLLPFAFLSISCSTPYTSKHLGPIGNSSSLVRSASRR